MFGARWLTERQRRDRDTEQASRPSIASSETQRRRRTSGMLTGKYRKREPPPEGSMMALRPDMASDFDEEASNLVAAVTKVAEALDVSNVAVAFAWLLSQPGVVPIAGTSKPHHMEAIEQALQIDLSSTHIHRQRTLKSAHTTAVIRSGRTGHIAGYGLR